MMDEGRGMVGISVRVSPETKALWQRLADGENRSLTNYIVMLLEREGGKKQGVSLETLDWKLDYLMKLVNEEV
jgi:hypothetical protein